MTVAEVYQSHPHPVENQDLLQECATLCIDCAQSCISCADACLAEPDVDELVRCIRTNLDCGDTCQATNRILSRQTEWNSNVVQVQLEACRLACRLAADECERHSARHKHCRACADMCRACEEMCRHAYTRIRG